MKPIIIEESSVARAARKAIRAVWQNGEKVERVVGKWCLMKPGKHFLHELHNVTLTITDPRKRWNSRVNTGMLTETLDYFLGLNPGYTHKSTWKFYKQWIEKKTRRYPYTYGARVFGSDHIDEEINQWKEVVRMLRKDPRTRHAHITLYRPNDLFREFVPCNFAWHFQTDSQGNLNMITYCRSQDALRGLFLDLFAYTSFLEQMARATNLPLGSYTVVETNLHIYERDTPKLKTDFANPTEPYTESIEPGSAPLLTEDDKKILQRLLRQIFDFKKYPVITKTGLSTYWKDWIIFIATMMLEKSGSNLDLALSEIETAEIRWTLKKNIVKREESTIN